MVRDGNKGEMERPEALYSHVAELTRSALDTAQGSKQKIAQRRAKGTLIKLLQQSEYFEPVFVAFQAGLGRIQTTREERFWNGQLRTLGEVLAAATNDTQDKGGKDARINPTIERTLTSLVALDEGIMPESEETPLGTRIKGLPQVHAAYETVMRVAKYIDNRAKAGISNVEVSFREPGEPPIEIPVEHPDYDAWWRRIKEVFNTTETNDGAVKDDIVSVLKEEPAVEANGKKPFVKIKYAGLSFEDLEQAEYPLNDDATAKWMDYLTTVFTEPSPEENSWLDKNRATILPFIFFSSSKFTDAAGIEYNLRNKQFLANTIEFQHAVLSMMLHGEDGERLQPFLQAIPKTSSIPLLASLVLFTTYPEQRGPLVDGTQTSMQEHGRFSRDALTWKEGQLDRRDHFYSDEIGYEYLLQVLLPLLRQRTAELGVSDSFDPAITEIERQLGEKFSFGEAHLEFIKGIFRQNCGDTFMETLGRRTEDIQAITDSAWELTQEEGMHFLPMMQGFNTVNFTEGSVPDMMGIEAVSFNTTGELDNWQTNVIFSLRNTKNILLATLDDQGHLQFKTHLESEEPGLHAMLQNIAVLLFRDLTVQVQKTERQQEPADAEPKDLREGEEEIIKPQGRRRKSKGGSLPRTQTDRDLIAEVSQGSGFTPRPVEMHTSWVRGGKKYKEAIDRYTAAQAADGFEENEAELRAALDAAREGSYRASATKIGSWPSRFEPSRMHVTDPVTSDVCDLRTWVIEHKSPKPTEDETKSPVLLYTRYYGRSSSLAMLEQFKPWFVAA